MQPDTDDTVTITLASATRASLDELGRILHRDTAALLQDAIEAYVALQNDHIEQIKIGLHQASTGQFASDEEVAAAYAAFR